MAKSTRSGSWQPVNMDVKASDGQFSISCCSLKVVRWLDAVRHAAFAAERDAAPASTCVWANGAYVRGNAPRRAHQAWRVRPSQNGSHLDVLGVASTEIPQALCAGVSPTFSTARGGGGGGGAKARHNITEKEGEIELIFYICKR